ncbi:hypothetical protein NPX13_g11365 [Xylaria arbuscula]|uniref:laccase n=1 Tax=Xylaria arbuscula TaxID=114810 RepID=A0A9W8N320_9PEZI|nr:hypothetical protein NPX13_g11365 [Xylaria arbuscula]
MAWDAHTHAAFPTLYILIFTSVCALLSDAFFPGRVFLLGLLARFGQCVPSRPSALEIRGPGACFTPSNRACWSPGFDINTDYETKTPPGIVRTFNWEVTEHDQWTGPDGRVKSKVMLVNNQYPGPTLKADWGDTVVVNIKNSLKINGTGFHWHGMRQLGTNIQDGANGVTECPIPPGVSKTYKFKLTQYGTSWYHSHFSGQYGNGVFGPIVINGPASLPYDIDLGAYPINDYYLRTADDIVWDTIHIAGPPPPTSSVKTDQYVEREQLSSVDRGPRYDRDRDGSGANQLFYHELRLSRHWPAHGRDHRCLKDTGELLGQRHHAPN